MIAIANSYSLALLEINAVEMLNKRRDEMLARLFTIADDVDAGLSLIVQGQTQGVLLAHDQFFTSEFPR